MKKQGNFRGWSQHLAGGVVTDLGEVSVPSETSQSADFHNSGGGNPAECGVFNSKKTLGEKRK